MNSSDHNCGDYIADPMKLLQSCVNPSISTSQITAGIFCANTVNPRVDYLPLNWVSVMAADALSPCVVK